jgi:DNA-directed RNA polymerase specialized sigma24 family protein
MLRARSGDRQALEDLVQRHQAWIYNIAVRMLYHPQDAEDATQEILIKVLPGSRHLRAEAASARGCTASWSTTCST